MRWITREHPKIDRIACPWLIKRFIDKHAEIIYVPFNEVMACAEMLQAIPFDVPGVEYTHHQDRCTFDYFLSKHALKDPALDRMAAIIRGADTDRHDFAPEAAGLHAIFAGLSQNIKDDHQLLELGVTVYDGLYTWAKDLYTQKHTQGPVEQLLVQVFSQYLDQRKHKKTPAWAKELKHMLQDQVDTNVVMSLQQVSEDLEINASYLSRAFSKHFDDLTFGDYIRKMRIDKAIKYIDTTEYSLTEIAYLTGFSDQSHFTRIFKKQTGHTPAIYKKQVQKGKAGTNG